MSREISIGRHIIGLDHPVYFIADIAANHDGDLERAKDLIFMCAEAGANGAKFQNFRAEKIVSEHGFKGLGRHLSHQAKWDKSIYEIYEAASLPLEWTKTLKETCDKAGIDYFTAPYDLELIPLLSDFVCAWKLGSGDITWHKSIEMMAKDGKPFLIATGASNMNEVRQAMDIAGKYNDRLVLMQCNTDYTGSQEVFQNIALNVLKAYAREFPDTILGLSDHTPSHSTVLGAVALGARAIEKHFTDDITRRGPDHAFSVNPSSWREMVDRSRELEAALGTEEKRVMENERETVLLQRRAVRTVRAVRSGETLTESHLAVLRPCPKDALPPFRMDEVIGRRVNRDIAQGENILLADVG